jgi:hypothetical protein
MLVVLDLPGDLVREMRRKAAQEGRKLSNTAEECIRRGFTAGVAMSPADAEAFRLSGGTDDPAEGAMSLGECLWRAKIR